MDFPWKELKDGNINAANRFLSVSPAVSSVMTGRMLQGKRILQFLCAVLFFSFNFLGGDRYTFVLL